MDVGTPPRNGQAGFSLVEILVTLGLFSLIALAGVVLVGSILQVRERTEGRLEELGELQRAMLIITSDFQQARGGSLRVSASGASLERLAEGRLIGILYAVEDGRLVRTLSASGGPGGRQIVLDQLAGVSWRVYRIEDGWGDTWPRAAPAGTPLALAVEMDLDASRVGLSGAMRRVVELAAPS